MRFLQALVLVVLTASTSMAGFDYSFQAARLDTPTTLGNTSLNGVGSDIGLYLVQTPNGGDVATAFTGRWGVDFVLQPGFVGTVTATSTVGTPFGGVTTPTPGRFRFNALVEQPSSLVNGFHAVQLGAFQITGGIGQIANFAIEDISLIVPGNTQVNSTPIDATVYGNSNSFAVAVPEPSSAALLLFAGAGFCLRRRRA